MRKRILFASMLFVYEILKKVEITLLKPKDNPDPVPRIIETSEAPPVEHLYNVIQRSVNLFNKC